MPTRKAKAKPDRPEPAPSAADRALHDVAIQQKFFISKATLQRWRDQRGFPQPSYYVGPRPFTWESAITAWTQTLPTTSPIAERRPQRRERATA